MLIGLQDDSMPLICNELAYNILALLYVCSQVVCALIQSWRNHTSLMYLHSVARSPSLPKQTSHVAEYSANMSAHLQATPCELCPKKRRKVLQSTVTSIVCEKQGSTLLQAITTCLPAFACPSWIWANKKPIVT